MSAALPSSPAAERNQAPIFAVLRPLLPRHGTVFEIAAGTGQHAVHFARATPDLRWLASDPEPRNLEIMRERFAASTLPNLAAPLLLDVHQDPWPLGDPVDLMVCINMIHIAPWSATAALFRGARQQLHAAGTGIVLTYGPYREAGVPTAPSNEEFDRSLRARDGRWGLRDLEAVAQVALQEGFALERRERMPANNLCVIWRRTVEAPRPA